MKTEELNEKIRSLIQSPDNCQEFANLASPEKNWRRIDKNIPVPSYIGLSAPDCPSCFETVRLIFDKYSTQNEKFKLTCPHCKTLLVCKLEFTGYTSDAYLDAE